MSQTMTPLMNLPPDPLVPRPVTVACTQMACSWDIPANVERAERLVRTAAAHGRAERNRAGLRSGDGGGAT